MLPNYLRVPVPLPHGVHDDALEVERVGVPGVVEDDARVGVVPQEDLQHLRQHLRPEVGQRRVDLDQPQRQHVGAVRLRNLTEEAARF